VDTSPTEIAAEATFAIMAERSNQIRKGFGPDHDQRHSHGELVSAALAYLTGDPTWWPWPSPAPVERDRVKVGAFLVAERDRQATGQRYPVSTRGNADPDDIAGDPEADEG
jgi:hypothetical protein